jgi:hypothetical protein
LEAAQRLRREATEWLKEHQPESAALEHVIDSVFGNSYFDRLRRWVGRRLPSDFDSASSTGFDKADTLVRQLAQEGFRKQLSEEELRWLASPEAENVWAFGHRLGELDETGSLTSAIVAVSSADLNCMLLASYLVTSPFQGTYPENLAEPMLIEWRTKGAEVQISPVGKPAWGVKDTDVS